MNDIKELLNAIIAGKDYNDLFEQVVKQRVLHKLQEVKQSLNDTTSKIQTNESIEDLSHTFKPHTLMLFHIHGIQPDSSKNVATDKIERALNLASKHNENNKNIITQEHFHDALKDAGVHHFVNDKINKKIKDKLPSKYKEESLKQSDDELL